MEYNLRNQAVNINVLVIYLPFKLSAFFFFFFFTKVVYVWHLVVQKTEEIYRTGCSDIVSVWASGISYS